MTSNQYKWLWWGYAVLWGLFCANLVLELLWPASSVRSHYVLLGSYTVQLSIVSYLWRTL